MDIKQFSKLVGVSTATVSRAFSGNGRISAETRSRIFALAREHGYTPNIHAQRLNSRKNNILGVYYSFSSEPIFDYYHMELAQELAKAAAAGGYTVHLELAQKTAEPSDSLLRSVAGGGLDGIIIVGDSQEDAVAAIRKFHPCPCVVIANRLWDLPDAVGIVRINQDSGIAEAVAKLHEVGHRRIGLIRGKSGGSKLDAFLKAVRAQGLTAPADLVKIGPRSFEDGVRAIGELIPAKISAVLCSTDIIALGAISGAASAGLSVPGDLSIVGIDNLAFTPFVSPPLSSVGIPRREIAEAAVSIIDQVVERSITDPGHPPRQFIHTINTRFIHRGSIAPPA